MKRRKVKSVIYLAIVAVDLAAWITIIVSTLCIINGGRWGMVIPLIVSVAAVWLAGELADAVDDHF